MEIIQVNPADKKQVQAFLNLPFHIYKNTPQWVPPLEREARLVLDPKRYPFYRHSQAAFFLVMQNGSPTGRLAVLENRRYNAYNGTRAGFFTLFECQNDPQAASRLFDAASAWARKRGLTELIGPKGFSVLDGFGMLVKGFQHRPAFGIPYNPPYYPELLERLGFQMVSEAVSGYLNPQAEFPERIDHLSATIQKRRGLHIARYQTRNDLRALIPHLKELYNGALEGTTGTYPLEDDEVKVMADQVLWFADPKLVKVVMKGEKPVGFLLAYPDISAAVQKTRGKLMPFGWLALLRAMKTTDWININGAGMIDEYRGLGGTAILFSEMYKTMRASGQFRHADLVQIGLENDRMQRELRDLGVDFYKTHRVYRKNL
ncbi:MAG: hypothetical protein Fur0016_18540 [Anaerolineales bacterium]